MQSNYVKSLRILLLALLFGQVFFFLIGLFLKFEKIDFSQLASMKNIFMIVAIAFALLGTIVGFFIWSRRIQNIAPTISLEEKLAEYRAAFITRCAMMEAPAFLCLIFFLLSQDYLFVGIWAVIVIAFLSNYPTLDKIASALQLTEDEKLQIT